MALLGRFPQPAFSFLVVLALKPVVAHGEDMSCLGGSFQPPSFFLGIAALKGVAVVFGPDVAPLRSLTEQVFPAFHFLLVHLQSCSSSLPERRRPPPG